MRDGHRTDDLDAWVLATAPRAVALARSLLRHTADAEDIVQDCYCRLLAKAGKYDLPQDGLKLLLRSVTNACINLRTRRKPLFSLVTGTGDGVEDPPDPRTHAVDEGLIHRELGDAVAAALQSLPPLQRAAVELKSRGHSHQDIAEILDVTPTHAGVLVHRARQTLATILAPYLGGETDP